MSGTLIFCLALFTFIVAMGYMVKSAPEGYEDRYGFHLGKPPRTLGWQSRRAIGHNLRQFYSAILTQPMPRQFYAYTSRLWGVAERANAGPGASLNVEEGHSVND